MINGPQGMPADRFQGPQAEAKLQKIRELSGNPNPPAELAKPAARPEIEPGKMSAAKLREELERGREHGELSAAKLRAELEKGSEHGKLSAAKLRAELEKGASRPELPPSE